MATDDKKKDEPTGAKADKAPDAKADDKNAPIDTGEEDAAVEAQAAEDPAASADPFVRAEAAGIGRVDPRRDAVYVGLTPALEADPLNVTGPDGLAVTSKAIFTPLRDVMFYNSVLVKDPASGTYYHPAPDQSNWEECALDGVPLIPAATTPVGTSTKKKAAGANGPTSSDDAVSGKAGHEPSAKDQDKATKDAAHDVNKDLKK